MKWIAPERQEAAEKQADMERSGMKHLLVGYGYRILYQPLVHSVH